MQILLLGAGESGKRSVRLAAPSVFQLSFAVPL